MQAALKFLHTTQDDDPDLSALATSYEIPVSVLQALWEARQSKQEPSAANQKLSEDQEVAVRQYRDRLDMVGTSTRLPIVTGCANTMLQQAHTGPSTVPVLSEQWSRHFLSQHPEYFICK